MTGRVISVRLLFFACMTFAASSYSQPKLSKDRDTFNFGLLYNGQVKKAGWMLTNVGTDTLEIFSVLTAREFDLAKTPKEKLSPGESDFMEVEFNSTGLRGQLRRECAIFTSDPGNNAIRVGIAAHVIEELETVTPDPASLWLRSVVMGKEIREWVIFKNVSTRTITITNVASSSIPVRLGVDRVTVIPAGIVPDKEGCLNEWIFFVTDSVRQTRVPLKVSYLGIKSE